MVQHVRNPHAIQDRLQRVVDEIQQVLPAVDVEDANFLICGDGGAHQGDGERALTADNERAVAVGQDAGDVVLASRRTATTVLVLCGRRWSRWASPMDRPVSIVHDLVAGASKKRDQSRRAKLGRRLS